LGCVLSMRQPGFLLYCLVYLYQKQQQPPA